MRLANLTMIAAADASWGIGIGGRLPWHVPEDMKHFKTRTMGREVWMGRRTVEGLPLAGGIPPSNPNLLVLPGRRVVSLSRRPQAGHETLEQALFFAAIGTDDDVLVAGGAEIYRAAEPWCSRAEITRISGEHSCDVFLPDLSALGWTLVKETPLSDRATIEEWRPS